VLDEENQPLLTERDVLRNLQAIVSDADKTPRIEVRSLPYSFRDTYKFPWVKVARSAMGILSTENRKTWSSLRTSLSRDRNNASCLHIVDNALFIVCLDDATPTDLADLSNTFLCGTYGLDAGVQIGTCTNRWYDKVSRSPMVLGVMLTLL
jgi:carnitine O-acetyltransferase